MVKKKRIQRGGDLYRDGDAPGGYEFSDPKVLTLDDEVYGIKVAPMPTECTAYDNKTGNFPWSKAKITHGGYRNLKRRRSKRRVKRTTKKRKKRRRKSRKKKSTKKRRRRRR